MEDVPDSCSYVTIESDAAAAGTKLISRQAPASSIDIPITVSSQSTADAEDCTGIPGHVISGHHRPASRRRL